jgi:hypothetical protein
VRGADSQASREENSCWAGEGAAAARESAKSRESSGAKQEEGGRSGGSASGASGVALIIFLR